MNPDPEQRVAALVKANHVRVFRAELKRQIGEGSLSVQSVLLSPPLEAATMTVYGLLMARHRWGRHKTIALLRRHSVSESMTVKALTDRQRAALVDHLNGCGPMIVDMEPRQVRSWQQAAA